MCNLLHFTASSSATSDEDENDRFCDNREKHSEKHVKGASTTSDDFCNNPEKCVQKHLKGVPFVDAPKGGMYNRIRCINRVGSFWTYLHKQRK